MDFQELLNLELIQLDINPASKENLIQEMIDGLAKSGALSDKEIFMKDVLTRESQCATAVGRGIAIPHGKSSGVKKTSIAFARTDSAIRWDHDENEEVNLVFLLAIQEENANTTHLEILSKLATKLMDDDFIEVLNQAGSRELVMEAVKEI